MRQPWPLICSACWRTAFLADPESRQRRDRHAAGLAGQAVQDVLEVRAGLPERPDRGRQGFYRAQC